MKPEEKTKLENRLDKLFKKLTDLYKIEKAIRIEINQIHVKLDSDGKVIGTIISLTPPYVYRLLRPYLRQS
jgi:hypothetical protein